MAGTSKTDEEKWQAESDADTLMRSGEIMADEKRHTRAKTIMEKKLRGAEAVKKMMSNMGSAKPDYSKSNMPERKK